MTQYYRDVLLDAGNSSRASRYQRVVSTARPLVLVAIASLAATGCASHLSPQATVTQIATFDRPAKPADCSIPVLYNEPITDHHKIAIVEAWGDLGQEDAVLAALRQSGCQTGADALVIVEGQSQMDQRTLKFGLPEDLQAQEEKTDSTQSERYQHNELKAPIGNSGHPGYYLDSVAIEYETQKGPRKTGN